MERYRLIQELGDGTYGAVSMAIKLNSGQKMAIKKMKKEYRSWEEAMSLKELKALKKLHHPNIVRLHEVIREKNNLYFVFEYMEMNLYQLINSRKDFFPEPAVRNMVYQILQGVAFMHKNGFFHRDLKPENILCCGPELVKIADFGLVREIRSKPPFTDYVSTRWYRAPEVLLRSGIYSCPVDIWAVGCVTAELYTFDPIFPGVNEIDQIFKICSILGTPTGWADGMRMAARRNFTFPRLKTVDVATVVRTASVEGIDFLNAVLRWDPKARPTAEQSLRLPYFRLKTNRTHFSNFPFMKIRNLGEGDNQENTHLTPSSSLNAFQTIPPTNLPHKTAKSHYLSKARYVSGMSTSLRRQRTQKEIRNSSIDKTFNTVTAQPVISVRTNWAAKYLH